MNFFVKKLKKTQKNPEIPKKKIKKPLILFLKDFLVYLGIMEEETYIDDILGQWAKSLLTWFIDLLITGFLISIAIIPFYIPNSYPRAIINIVGLGMLYWMVTKVYEEVYIKGQLKLKR
jgi:hypothetical protein